MKKILLVIVLILGFLSVIGCSYVSESESKTIVTVAERATGIKFVNDNFFKQPSVDRLNSGAQFFDDGAVFRVVGYEEIYYTASYPNGIRITRTSYLWDKWTIEIEFNKDFTEWEVISISKQ